MQKREQDAVAMCLLLLAGLFLLYYLVDKYVELPDETPAKTAQNETKTGQNRAQYYSDYEQVEPKLQNFDPNTADSTTLLALGLPPHIVRSIYKYRAHGGVYSSVEDFARIPHLTQKQYKTLRPYIVISDDFKPAAELVGPRQYPRAQSSSMPRDSIAYPVKLSEQERVELNAADTAELMRVPGIGSHFAHKIVELRNKFGGFNSLDQLLRINNFPESALQYFILPDGGITKININRASFQRLAAHPYIGYNRTKSIMDYRKLKGKITSLKQLSLLPGFSDEEIALMEPYIDY